MKSCATGLSAPGTTALNIGLSTKNASPVFLQATDRVIQFMIAAGLPER